MTRTQTHRRWPTGVLVLLSLALAVGAPTPRLADGPMLTVTCRPSAPAWAGIGWLTVARSSHTATHLPDGLVLVAGGGEDDAHFRRS